MLKPNKGAALFGLAVAVAALGGCDEYLDRSDTITYGVGDAVAVNRATQTIERWPNAARYDRWATDGERSRIAIERYRERKIRIEKPEGSIVGKSQTTQ